MNNNSLSKDNENQIYGQIKEILTTARTKVYSAVNFAMVEAYWLIGKQIVEAQAGNERAEYGSSLLKYLSERLTRDFGKGFTVTNLTYMRQFYLTFPIRHALRDKLGWTHYRLIMKTGKLTHQDIGQMQMYVNFYTRELMNEGDNPPIGIILCADKSESVVRYTLSEDNSQVFTSKYKLYLPTEEELSREIETEKNFLMQEYTIK